MVPEYSHISINDILPSDRRERYFYMSDIVLPFNVEMYSYHQGGPKPSLYFMWKCDDGPDLSKSTPVIHHIEKDLPTYHTCAMRQQFVQVFSPLVKTSPAMLVAMHRFLTDDAAALPNKV